MNGITPEDKENTSITKDSIFKELQEEIIKHFSNIPSFSFTFTYSKEKSQLMILIKLIKHSELNPREDNITFLIILNNTYPYSEPIVLCKSNFSNPTLFDNRNLAKALIEKWSQKNTTNKLISIISHIPAYLFKVERDKTNRLLYYDGDYNYTYYYNVNDFLLNPVIFLFKIDVPYSQVNSSELTYMESYMLLTGIYIILLFPNETVRNRAKIIFQGELIMIDSLISQASSNETNQDTKISISIKWNENYHKKLNKILLIRKEDSEIITNVIEERKRNLNKDFEIAFPNGNDSIDELKTIIYLRESEMSEENSFYVAQDLMELYQKMIEIYSEDNKEKCSEYIGKLQQLVKTINK